MRTEQKVRGRNTVGTGSEHCRKEYTVMTVTAYTRDRRYFRDSHR